MPGNAELAALFNEMADILDIQGANVFRVRAYHSAARTIESLGTEVADMCAHDPAALNAIPGIGKGLHDKIVEFCARGALREHDELKASIPPGLLDMLRLNSFGPKRVKLVFDSLHISSVDALEQACLTGQIRNLPGMGEKSEAKLLNSIRDFRTLQTGRVGFAAAEQVLEPYLAHLRSAAETIHHDPGLIRKHASSDARHFTALGIPAAIFGPGGENIHGLNEWVDLRQVNQFYKILERFLEAAMQVDFQPPLLKSASPEPVPAEASS